MKKNIIGLSLKQLSDEIKKLHSELFRAQQLCSWIYKKGVIDFNLMSNIPQALREKLMQEYSLDIPEINNIAHSSKDNSYKFLLKNTDGTLTETLLMFHKERTTLCVSCMVGCPLRCAFCATGMQVGFVRKLSAAEIIGQLLTVQKYAREKNIAQTIDNIVFMGMGEPFLNLEAIEPTIEILVSDYGFCYARTRITLSTAGVGPGCADFMNKYKVRLAVSLHFPTNEERSKFMPINKKFPLEKLIQELKKINLGKRDAITIEYIMFNELNDTPKHAQLLVKLLSHLKVKINLIPYNPSPDSIFKPSTEERLNLFIQALRSKSFIVTVRRSAGVDISGGCGQFALKTLMH
jgi:23S rRNA (adenine2503-C2)-methyltransferase